jgi:hypothetical protein
MKNYFETILETNLPIELITDISLNFLVDNNELPTEKEFDIFITDKMKSINFILERLTKAENIIYLNKVEKELSKEYIGARKYYLEKINLKQILALYPEYSNKNNFELPIEKLVLLENKYSLYQYFDRTLKILLNFITQINSEPSNYVDNDKGTIDTKVLISNEVAIEVKPITETQFDFERELNDLKNAENKFDKSLPMSQVIEHFKVFTTIDSNNGSKFLTEKQFISFIKKGFLNDNSQPKQSFNYKNGEKGFIIKRFYEFFFDVAVSKHNVHNRKKPFIQLVENCFEGMEYKKVESNFRSNKTLRTW